MRSAIWASEINSSCPSSALVVGVKSGVSRRWLSPSPSGAGLPPIVPLRLYSAQPEPAR